MKKFERRDKNEKRRLLLNKRLDHKVNKTERTTRTGFGRPSDSTRFVKGGSADAVRAPLNKRFIALILAIVMVLGLIPAGVFMLRPKAASNGLGPVEMSVRVNGADDFTTAVVPGGEISRTVGEAEYALALPDSFLYRKAVVIDSSDNSETEIFSVGSLGRKTYYSLNENSATGTLLNDETQKLVLVVAEKYNVTLNYNEADGTASTSALDGNYIWGGDSLRVQGTPNRDRTVQSITYSINGGASNSVPVSNNAATIPASAITGDITVNVNFVVTDKYAINEVGNNNHGGLTTGTRSNDKAGAQPVAPGETASFYVYSESNTGGSNFVFNMLSINGVDIEYPIEAGEANKTQTAFRDGTVTVALVDTDTALLWNNNGNERNYGLNAKHRSLYKVDVSDVHENLDVAFHFKQKTDRQIIIKGLRGIQETGATIETRGDDTKYIHIDQTIDNSGWLGVGVPVRNYRFVKNDNNFYNAYYNQAVGGNFSGSIPSANIYFYRVKPGYNPYSVAESNVYAQYYNDNNALISTVHGDNLLAGNSSADRPDTVIQKASEAITAGAQEAVKNDLGALADWQIVNDYFVWLYQKLGAYNSEIRYWGASDILINGKETQAKDNSDYAWTRASNLALTSIQDEEKDPSIRWYAIALNQNAANNQQLYINADLYQYYLRLDLGNGGSLANSNDRFSTNGNVLTEKDAYKHTVDDREKYITFPAETPINSDGSVIFGGWRAIDANGDPILKNGEEIIYQSLEQIKFDWENLSYAYGKDTGADSDVKQVLAFEAVWHDLRTANITTISVETWAEVPEGTQGAIAKETTSEDGNVTKYYKQIAYQKEVQPVNQETLILNYPEPENANFYELNRDLSKLDNNPDRQDTIEVIPEHNQFKLYYDIAYEDLSVTKQVQGNPTQLNDGFEITIKITKPEGAPLDAAEALTNIVFSNGDGDHATVNGNTITYTKKYGRSESVTLSNVPHGWNVTVSEPKASVNQTTGNADYETTIVSEPEALGSQIAEEDNISVTTWEGVLNATANIKVINKSDSYLILDKNIDRNNNGTYDLTLEAFATGDIEKETKVEKTPTDFVLVLDQSGSMAYGDMPTKYTKDNKTSWTISDIPENGTAYYYLDEESGKYYRVFQKHGIMYEYILPNTKYADDITGDVYEWFANDSVELANVAHPGGYAYKDPDDGKYYSLNASVYGYFVTGGSGSIWDNVMGYRCYLYYFDSNGNKKYVQTAASKTDNRGAYYIYREALNIRFSDFSDKIDKPLFIRHSGYSQLCYKDENGIEHTLIDATYCDSSGKALGGVCEKDQKAPGLEGDKTQASWNGTLYRASSSETRLQSLNTALKQFVASVSEQEDSYGKVQNRVAIVGFSSENTSGNNYNNTELLTGVQILHGANGSMSTSPGTTSGYSLDGRTHDGTQYNPSSGEAEGIPSNTYAGTLLDVTDAANIANITRNEEGIVTSGSGNLFTAIDAVTAKGGTKPAYGLKMAEQIFASRGASSEYEKQSTGEKAKRNTVVIFFTDGRPGNNDTVDQYDEANAVVEAAQVLKKQKDSDQTPLNTKIYSIGVFGESDGNPLTYPYANVSGNESINQNTAETNARNIHNYDFELAYVRSEVTRYTTRQSGFLNLTTNYIYYKDYYFRDYIGHVAGYPAQADDTIADYMRTVSSEYPEAKEFSYGINDNETYIDMIHRARGDHDDSDRYYYMASDHDNLLAAFEKVSETLTEEVDASTTGMAANAILRDVINQKDFKLPEKESDVTVKVYTVLGSQTAAQQAESASKVSFVTDDTGKEVRVDVTDLVDLKWTKEPDGRLSALDVTGFDYSANFIAFDKLPNDPESSELNKGTEKDFGKKLVVVISGLEPNETAVGELHSNTSDSGIYAIDESDESAPPQMINAFPIPQMYRYAYNFRETGEKTDDVFNIGLNRGDNGTDGIMVKYPRGNRSPEAITNGTYSWSNVTNGDAIYFETFDQDAYMKANVPDTSLDQEKYDYSVSLIDQTGTTPETFNRAFDMPEESSTIHVSNVSNTRTVKITEYTRGVPDAADYSDKEKQFPIQLKLTKADGTTKVDEAVTATIIRKADPEHPETVTLHFENGNSTVEVKLADGDSITFDTIKNYKLTVWEKSGDHDDYVDTYAPDKNGNDLGTGVIVIDDDNDKNVIDVINTLEQNPDIETGVTDSNDPSKLLFAVLGTLALLGAAGAGIWLWKKKDEFIED